VLATWEIIRPLDGAVLARGVTDYRQRGWRVGDYAGLVCYVDQVVLKGSAIDAAIAASGGERGRPLHEG
jgi:hypothetical protein